MNPSSLHANTPRTVIFLHIPKAAGSTLGYILDQKYNPDEIFSSPSGYLDSEEQAFINLPYEQQVKIRFVRGHMHFGWHEILPNPSTYVTIVRNPVDRIVSYYYYLLRSPGHYLYDAVTFKNVGLEELVCSGVSVEFDNEQTRLLAGKIGKDIPFGECPEELLDQAVNNLTDHFAVVGLAERFDETLVLLTKKLGWGSTPLYSRLNVTSNRPKLTAISDRTIKVIEQYNKLDMALYEYVRKSFNRAMREQGYSIWVEAIRFKTWNRIHPVLTKKDSWYTKLYRALPFRPWKRS